MDIRGEDTQLAVTALRARRASGGTAMLSAAVEAENCERVLADRRHGLTL